MSSGPAPNADSTNEVIVPATELYEFSKRCMERVGAPSDQAGMWAELIVAADLRGHFSHGMNRLEFYLKDVKAGNTAVDKEPEIVEERAGTALVNGNNLLGPVIGRFCMDLAIQKAKTAGIGWVSARDCNHFGIAGWYSMRAMEQGMIGMAFCNTSPNLIPTRGKVRTMGTNPISLGANGENKDSFVLDMATTAVAQGKVELKHRLGQPVPYGWGVDRHGKMCTDAEEVLKYGGLCPLGGSEETSGYKGFGLSLMVDIFCGVLSGSSFGTNVRAYSPDGHDAKANLGLCFVAIDPKAFAPGFESRLSELLQQCRGCPKADGETEIHVAGDPERLHTEKCERLGGIPYHPKQIAFADSVAEKYGVKPLGRKS